MITRRFPFLIALAALMFAVAAPLQVSAQETEGIFEGPPYYWGGYDEGITDNDWYYDYYELGADADVDYDADWFDTGWYDQEYYSGYYDTVYDNDWFYDTYDDPGDEGIFDI